jgi:uncharacterized protein YfaQ (DUF2300 family)
MRAPLAPSSVYRAQGMRPVYWQGLVLWLTPHEYSKVSALADPGATIDATDAQIEAQDRWYEQAKIDREQETAEWRRFLSRFAALAPAAAGAAENTP